MSSEKNPSSIFQCNDSDSYVSWHSFITIATDVEILNIDYTALPNSSDLITYKTSHHVVQPLSLKMTHSPPSQESLWNVFIVMIKSIIHIHIIFAFFRPVLERVLQVHPDLDILSFDPLWNHLQSQPTLHTSRVYSIQSRPAVSISTPQNKTTTTQKTPSTLSHNQTLPACRGKCRPEQMHF